MKKLVIGILAVVLIFAAVFVWRLYHSDDYIYEANMNIDIKGLQLLMKEVDVKDLLDENFTPSGGFGCNPYINEKDGVEIVFSGFPDVLDEYKLTSIETTNSIFSFYDLHTGNSSSIAEDTLVKSGFSRVDINNGKASLDFSKKSLFISLSLDTEMKISKIRIRLESTNRDNVVF